MLGGSLSPFDGVEPGDLRIDELLRRVEANGVQEVVLATNPNMTGEATAAFLADRLRGRVRVTRLASGLPVGGDLEYADEVTLGRASPAAERCSASRDGASRQEALRPVGDPEAERRHRQLREHREQTALRRSSAWLSSSTSNHASVSSSVPVAAASAPTQGERRQAAIAVSTNAIASPCRSPTTRCPSASVDVVRLSDGESQIVHGSRPTPIAAKTTITHCAASPDGVCIAAYTVAE